MRRWELCRWLRQRSHWRPLSLPSSLIAGLALVLTLAAGCGSPWAPPTPPATPQVIYSANGQMNAILATPAPDLRPALSAEEATTRARLAVARSGDATNISARYTLLTLTTVDDRAVLQARPTWLVVYEGVSYSTPASCSCHESMFPNTTVALDAQDGRILLAFGSYL